ncbi:MAG: hypothetical protein ACOYL3_18860 [Desulfuromonadaceae bacterium]
MALIILQPCRWRIGHGDRFQVKDIQQTETAVTTAAVPDPVRLVILSGSDPLQQLRRQSARGDSSTVFSRRFRSSFSRIGGIPAMVKVSR